MTPSMIESACERLNRFIADSYGAFVDRIAFVVSDEEFKSIEERMRTVARDIRGSDNLPCIQLTMYDVPLVRRSKLSELPPPAPPREWTRDDIRREIIALAEEGKIKVGGK